MKKILHNFSKTSNGETYAFLEYTCTHKKLRTLKTICNYQHLQKVDLSYNNLTTLKYLSGLKYLTTIIAINNQLTSVLDMKYIPQSLDYVDLSHNLIVKIPSL
jgi:Leucine-rich repeat (LRR) protein